jgi:phosphatidylinositol-3-phosphatase
VGAAAARAGRWIGLGAALALIACSSTIPGHPAPAAAAAGPCGATVKPPAYTHVIVIAFENHSYASVLGSSAPASYFKTLAAECGSAAHLTSAAFPHSLPNYLAVTGGTTAGITGDCTPSKSCSVSGSGIFGQLGAGNWRVWAQSSTQACAKAAGGAYVPRHNPAVYYTGLPAATCQADDAVPPATLPAPERAFTWISPDIDHDMTLDSVADAGSWLQGLLAGPRGLLNSAPYSKGHTAIFIWFDSAADTDSASTTVPLIVIAPSVGHRTVTTPITDYGILHGWEGLLGLPCMGQACSVSGFDNAFRL